MKYILLILTLMVSANVQAQQWLTMDPHVLIDIESYDPASRTYEITDLKYPGQGPLIATPEELARCISALDIEKLKRHPTAIIHDQYQTEKKMLFLSPAQISARRSGFRKSKSG